MTPRLSTEDLADGGRADSVLASEHGLRLMTSGSDFEHLFFIQDVHAVSGTALALSAKFSVGVALIFALGDVLQVVSTRITAIAVFMVALLAGRRGANEGFRDKDMHLDSALAPFVENPDARIAVRPVSFYDSSHTSHVADFVVWKVLDRLPYFNCHDLAL